MKLDHHELCDLNRLSESRTDEKAFHCVRGNNRVKSIDVFSISIDPVCRFSTTGHNLESRTVTTVKRKTSWAFFDLPFIVLQRIYNQNLSVTIPIVSYVNMEWNILSILAEINVDPSCLWGCILHIYSCIIT